MTTYTKIKNSDGTVTTIGSDGSRRTPAKPPVTNGGIGSRVIKNMTPGSIAANAVSRAIANLKKKP